MKFRYIDLETMEKICHRIAMAFFNDKNDPISEFSDHELSLLDSALSNPSRVFDGKELYPTLAKKTAILYYSLIKNHCFKNGNKRVATVSLLVFLGINGYWLKGNKKELENYLVDTAIKVAKSDSKKRNDILLEIEKWLNEYMVETSHNYNHTTVFGYNWKKK